MDNLKGLNFNDEIRIGFHCIKLGIIEFNKFGPTTIELFIPLLLLSTGFERLLKILYCFDYYNMNGNFPTKKELKNKGHGLVTLTEHFLNVCEKTDIYNKASARINDIKFLKENTDFKKLLTILSNFAENQNRYYNLDCITGQNNIYSTDSPERLISKFLNEVIQRKQDIVEFALKPPYKTQIIYETFNPYIIELLQRFLRILCYGFTQGAFGNLARQYSANQLNDFLDIRDENLSKINFVV